MGNSGHYEEIGKWAGRISTGGHRMENSENYEEIGEMGWAAEHRGSGKREFGELWGNRGNGMTGSAHGPMFITFPFSILKLHTRAPLYKTTHISIV